MISDAGLLRPALFDNPDIPIPDPLTAPGPALLALAPNEPDGYLGTLHRL
jgi:hypothetical protein